MSLVRIVSRVSEAEVLQHCVSKERATRAREAQQGMEEGGGGANTATAQAPVDAPGEGGIHTQQS